MIKESVSYSYNTHWKFIIEVVVDVGGTLMKKEFF
jgi:hypothetical protein